MATAVVSSSRGTDGRTSSASLLRWSAVALVLVGVAFLVTQLVLVPRPMGLSTDEATYLAKADPAAPELYWSAPRAWGVPVLTAPVALFSGGLVVLRTYLAFLSSTGLVLAFWPWRRLLHPLVAPLAALLFASTWFTLLFGSLAMPNLYSALSAVAVVGLTLRAVERPRSWWPAVAAGLAAALLALVRPTDSVLVVGPLGLALLLLPRLRRLRPLVGLVVGEALGWLPWVVEAYARFGGPVNRLRRGESAGPHGLAVHIDTLLIFPRLLDGKPNYCCFGGPIALAGPLPPAMTVWSLAVPLLALLGLLLTRGTGRTALLLVGLPAGLLGAFYLLLPSFLTPRFLLPTLALLCLPVACALVAVAQVGGGRWHWLSYPVVALLVGLHLALMLPAAATKIEREGTDRAEQVTLTAALKPYVGGRPCVILGHELQATAYPLHCRVDVASPQQRVDKRLRLARRNGELVIVVLRHSQRPRAGSAMSRWPLVTLPGVPHAFQIRTAPS